MEFDVVPDFNAVKKAGEFVNKEIALTYIIVSCVKEWQEQTGGTLGELLEYMDTHYTKREVK